jgi:CBS domain-containing protein
MSVGSICLREVDIAEPEENVQTAAMRMHARKVGSLVVVNKSREPIGIVTDRDLTVRVLAQGRDPVATTLSEVMTPRPKVVREGSSIEESLRLMRAGAFRRVPVVDPSGKLAGLVTLDDVLDLLSEEFREIRGVLEQESPRTFACGS